MDVESDTIFNFLGKPVVLLPDCMGRYECMAPGSIIILLPRISKVGALLASRNDRELPHRIPRLPYRSRSTSTNERASAF